MNQTLSEIYRVSRSHVNVQIPKISEVRKFIPLLGLKKPINNFDGEHYWETEKASYSLRRIVENIEKAGLKIKRTYGAFEMPYHRFFILKKTGDNDYEKIKIKNNSVIKYFIHRTPF
ncbi:MAG TPA: hypothetical protein ENI23_08855 [bacterium]|nr:hypothetical protein [bacterium]